MAAREYIDVKDTLGYDELSLVEGGYKSSSALSPEYTL